MKTLIEEIKMYLLIISVAIGFIIFGLFIRGHVIFKFLINHYGGKWQCLKKHLRLNSTQNLN